MRVGEEGFDAGAREFCSCAPDALTVVSLVNDAGARAQPEGVVGLGDEAFDGFSLREGRGRLDRDDLALLKLVETVGGG